MASMHYLATSCYGVGACGPDRACMNSSQKLTHLRPAQLGGSAWLALQHLDLEAQGGVGEYPPGGEAVGAVSVLGGGCDHRHLTLLHRHHAEVPAQHSLQAQPAVAEPLRSRCATAKSRGVRCGAGWVVHHAGMTWPMPMVNTKASCPGSFVDQNFFCKSESAVGKS